MDARAHPFSAAVLPDGYTAEEVTIYAGIPTHWTIKSTSNISCTFALVVPDLSIQVTLELGDNTVELPALSKGKLDYGCAMGMVGGRINVVDRPSGQPTERQHRDRAGAHRSLMQLSGSRGMIDP